METTERIVEAYVRYVKGWATIPNIRCAGQNEIDLIAIDPMTGDRYHIEVSISISEGFRKLTGKPFDREKVKQRVHQAPQRRTVGFFVERKFTPPTVLERLREFGFEDGGYARVIVTWGWDDAAADQAAEAGIELWDFRELVQKIGNTIRGSRKYFADDTLRTLNLFIHASDEAAQHSPPDNSVIPPPEQPAPELSATDEFWVYENWPNNCATVHKATCSFANGGLGLGNRASTENGQWLGPFEHAGAAWNRALATLRRDIRACGTCRPAIPN